MSVNQILFLISIFLAAGTFIFLVHEIFSCIRDAIRKREEKEEAIKQHEKNREIIRQFTIHMHQELYELEQMKAEMHPSEYTARPYYPDPPINHPPSTTDDDKYSTSEPHSHYFTSDYSSIYSSTSSPIIDISDCVVYHISTDTSD